jgi:hypothetical protein
VSVAPSTSAVNVLIDGLPMNSATNWLVGERYTSSGGPTCWRTPPFITAIRSPIAIASVWSCVT